MRLFLPFKLFYGKVYVLETPLLMICERTGRERDSRVVLFGEPW
jgi:hypothetical protein